MRAPSYDFTDTTVVVTGASSGIGRAIALRFGAAGATVINADLREATTDVDTDVPTHDRIVENGGTASFVETDVTDVGALRELVATARAYGGVDVMVNNAGISVKKPMTDVTPAEFDNLHAVNVRGVFFGCQVAATDMIERDDPGIIVNTASISSSRAIPDMVQYDATKGAVGMITRSAAYNLAEYGIRVNAIAPGKIATENAPGRTEQVIEDVANDTLNKAVPLGRAGLPADTAGAVLFLASTDADYITGELLHVDGGWRTF